MSKGKYKARVEPLFWNDDYYIKDMGKDYYLSKSINNKTILDCSRFAIQYTTGLLKANYFNRYYLNGCSDKFKLIKSK